MKIAECYFFRLQADTADGHQEHEHDQADMEILAALMDAPPGAVINITDTESQPPPARPEAIDNRHGMQACDQVSNILAATATTSVGNDVLPRQPVSTDAAGHLATAAAGPAAGAAETHLHDEQQHMAVTGVSEQTLAMTTAPSPTIQCTGEVAS